jgi:multiple sugar transport system substrate-binding protein
MDILVLGFLPALRKLEKSKLDESDMTREELLRVLTFADSLRHLSEAQTALASVDARWNIISYAMRRHFDGKLLTITSLADAAGVPYGTAMRRITELLDEGLLMRRPRSQSGKSFSLHPTRELIRQFEEYATQFKMTVGETFGFGDNDAPGTDFFFGGYYMTSRILSYPNAMRSGIGQDKTVRILCPMDPTFRTLADLSNNLKELCGANFQVTTLPLDELHQEIIDNNQRNKSKYDVVSVDLPWIGQLAESEAIRPLNAQIEANRYNASDFHVSAWRGARLDGRQYGIPIQPTVEMLFCRTDLFAEAGLDLPETTTDLLNAARALHRAQRGLSGIVMNFGRGTPVAHSFIQTLADFGSPIIDLTPTEDGYDVEEITGENFRPLIDTGAGRETLEFLREINQFAHPDSMRCDWDRRIAIFSKGAAAMTYGWSIRASKFELDEASPAHGNVEFMRHPAKPGVHRISPVGGFVLALPASLDEERAAIGWKVMEYLTRPELMKLYVQNGNLTSPRYSTSADPEVQAFSSMIRTVDQLEQQGELKIWPRPPIPEFSDLVALLGKEVHSALQGTKTVAAALADAQKQADILMRENGRY